jgi:hypothetical protein
MKRHEPRVTRITFKDAKSNMSTGEYHFWKSKWDKFWAKLIAEARRQIERGQH